MRLSLRPLLIVCALAVGIAVAPGASGCRKAPTSTGPIRVGVLHSLTGTMSISETSVKDATLVAIDLLNQRGGVMGRQIEPVVVDGKSDWPTFAREAERLILQEDVAVIFGCWTSASRKTVKPVFERLDHLLFYPVQYEGLEQSPNIVYTGAAPNQQIIPAVRWAMDHLGDSFYLVGSDYVFPQSANAIIRDWVGNLGGTVVGESYLMLGTTDVQAVVDDIVAKQPKVILNTINGDTNVAFYKALRAAGVTPDKIPSISFSIAEPELKSMGTSEMLGDYAAWNYFQTVNTPENDAFLEALRARDPKGNLTASDPMEAGYFGVFLWAQAASDAQSTDAREVRKHLGNQSFQAPGGLVVLDSATQHVWKIVRIGKIRGDGQFDIVSSSERPVEPVPFPLFRARGEWEKMLQGFFIRWGNRWANPGDGSTPAPTPTEPPAENASRPFGNRGGR